jgi:hypothetical protein
MCHEWEKFNKRILYMFFWAFSPASDWVLPTFRNPLSGPSSKARCGVYSNSIWRRGNTQKNIYKIQNTAKIWNKELCFLPSKQCYTIDWCHYDSPLKTILKLRYSRLLAGRSEYRITVDLRFQTLVQTGSGAHSAFRATGTDLLPWGKRPGCGVDHPPSSAPKLKEV